jgi:hypothetical protein
MRLFYDLLEILAHAVCFDSNWKVAIFSYCYDRAYNLILAKDINWGVAHAKIFSADASAISFQPLSWASATATFDFCAFPF